MSSDLAVPLAISSNSSPLASVNENTANNNNTQTNNATPSRDELQARAEALFIRWQKAFLGAIEKQSEKFILNMLREGEDLIGRGYLDVNVPIKPATGSTFLHTAAWFQKKEILLWLLQHGGDINQPNLSGNTPLHLVCENADKPDAPAIIAMFVEYNGDLNKPDANGITSITKALEKGCDVLKLLKGKAPAPAAAASSGASEAASGAAATETKRAKSRKEELKAQKAQAAAMQKKLATLFNGLEADASSTHLDDAIVAIIKKNEALIKSGWLDLSAPIESNAGKNCLLHLAVASRKLEIVKVLCLLKANPNGQNAEGETPLHIAAQGFNQEGGKQIMNILLESGGNIKVGTYVKGETPLDYAHNETVRRYMSQWKPSELELGGDSFDLASLGKLGTGAGGAQAGGLAVPGNKSFMNGGAGGLQRMNTLATAKAIAAKTKMLKAQSSSSAGEDWQVEIFAKPPVSGAKGGPALGRTGTNLGGLYGGLGEAKENIMASPPTRPAMSSSSTGPGVLSASAGASSVPRLAPAIRGLQLDQLMDVVDRGDVNAITTQQFHELHVQMHGCDCPTFLSQSIVSLLLSITRSNLSEALQCLSVYCCQYTRLYYSYRLMDYNQSGQLTMRQAELLVSDLGWDGSGAMRLDEYLAKKRSQGLQQGNAKPVLWAELLSEVFGQLPNVREIAG